MTRSSRSFERKADVPADLIEVARITGAHGIRGWVRLQPYSADGTTLDKVKNWWLMPPDVSDVAAAERAGTLSPVTVKWARVHSSVWLAQVNGIDDRDAALALRGYTVWISRADFPAPDEDEFYWTDLVGCDVYEVAHPVASEEDASAFEVRDDLRFGVVHSVTENPAHSILCVAHQARGEDGEWVNIKTSRGKLRESLIPFVAEHVPKVDLEKRLIWVDWPRDF